MGKAGLNPSYIGHRPDIERLILHDAQMILDVGCSIGTLGASVKDRTGARVVGIELSQEMGKEARQRLDEVLIGDAKEIFLQGKLDGCSFDCIVFADVLEHFADPWSVLMASTKYLKPGGTVIASIPNVCHVDTVFNLVIKGYWPYRERGIHDRTHLRFFTLKNIVEMFQNTGFLIDRIETNYRIFERPHRFNRIAQFLAIPGLRRFFAFQYVVRARLA